MSLQELDKNMAQETAGNGNSEGESERVSWFRRTFPHYFTPKVNQARNGVHTLPHVVGGQPLIRHLTHSQAVVVGLHRKPRGEFEFRLGGEVNLPVSREELIRATARVSKSPRVRIKLGTEVLSFDRVQLLTAFQKLEGTYRETD